MKKSKNKKRDAGAIAKLSARPAKQIRRASLFPSLNLIGQDNRFYQPAQKIQANKTLRRLTALTAYRLRNAVSPKTPSKPSIRAIVPFSHQINTLRRVICKTRTMRKQVLHAMKKTGKGARKNPRRLTWKSEVKC